MVKTHNLGFPRIGADRELKFALEAFWKGQSSRDALKGVGADLRRLNWQTQAGLDLIPVGDFSFYDHLLDMSFTLGNLPARVRGYRGDGLDNYFRVARGRSAPAAAGSENPEGVAAGEMTKWFDTNYHYIVPEFVADTTFALDASRLIEQIREAQALGVNAKPVIIGPVTYLALGKAKDDSDKLALLPKLLPVYLQLLDAIVAAGIEWVQIDEAILVTELEPAWKQAFETAYQVLSSSKAKLLLTTYFGRLLENLPLTASLPVAGVHLDAVNARDEVEILIEKLPAGRVLSLGVINGRNIWKTDLNGLLDWLEPVAQQLGDRLWIAPSCSLLHVPVDLDNEKKLDVEIISWLAFAKQKLEELRIIKAALDGGRGAVLSELDANQAAITSRRQSPRVHNPSVKAAVTRINSRLGQRQSSFAERALKQAEILNLPLYPTTTIGSFPQTADIRRTRSQFKAGSIDAATYLTAMHKEIARCVRE